MTLQVITRVASALRGRRRLPEGFTLMRTIDGFWRLTLPESYGRADWVECVDPEMLRDIAHLIASNRDGRGEAR